MQTFKFMVAYVDPGLGLLAWQALVAAVIGVLFYVKKTRTWLMGLLQKLFRRERRNQTVTAEVPAGKIGDRQ